MALTILSSNRVETLQARLTRQLAAEPLEDPFAPELIVVPTYAMSRWLNIRIAEQQGIAANIQYPQMGAWIWSLAGSLLDNTPARDPYSRDTLGWQVFAALPELLKQATFTPLRRYLDDDRSGIKCWQLALRIAESFDRYQAYRPQLIRDWSKNDDEQWQALLWRKIVDNTNLPHRVHSLSKLIDRLDSAQSISELPERVSLFALSSMPPLYLEVLSALSRHLELNLYLHSPTDQYWADLESEKRRSKLRLAQPELDELFDAGNELLSSWGRQGQIFQDLLLNHASTYSIDIDMFVEPENKNLLNSIQRSIFTVTENSSPAALDDSVSINVCHSAMRECQVLLDRILAMLDQDAKLGPEDILVMIPDIATYAPYIEAVFQRERVACNISDITLADEHPLVMTFLQLLNLPRSRFSVTDVLAYLDNEALCRCFSLDAGALQDIYSLVQQGNTRWGIEAEQKKQFDLPATPGNTWQQLQERFFSGYALSSDDLWNGIAPLPFSDEGVAESMGRFWHFFERLCHWRKLLNKSRSTSDWQVLLLQMLEEFFVETDTQDSRLQQIRQTISEIGAAPDCEISPELIVHLLEHALKTSAQSGQLYSGGITFCGMRPMRSIPFKVICLLGMNRADFPRRDSISDFEIMASQHHAGDPSQRDEDRYLMLETLLCARQKLYLSYSGRSLKDNSQQQPSVLLQEMLDFIDTRFKVDANKQKLSAQLTREYSLQAFSASNFEAPQCGYSRYWCEVSNQLASHDIETPRPWPEQPLTTTSTDNNIDLDQLRRFINHPIQYFFRTRLNLYLDRDDLHVDDETFDLNPLEQWRLKQQLARDTLSGSDQGSERLIAEGLLAHGQAAATQIDNIRQAQAGWFEALAEFVECRDTSLPIDLSIGNTARLSGTVNAYFPGKGLMAYHPGRFKGRHLLILWIDHLALCAGELWGADESSLLLATDQSWRIPRLDASDALRQLEDYCAIYLEGQSLPLPILPESSYAWACEADRHKAHTRLEQIWQNKWAQNSGGDTSDHYIEMILQGGYRLPFDQDRFEDYAQRLYTRLLQHGAKQ
ncbi:MAG: exodeoxyribonuclease V subunit gamma [Gammaproteobacteria bacterium]|nr:exodeoxyribonuclease V subunit gamma [Gammaproteobacteria bacterium]